MSASGSVVSVVIVDEARPTTPSSARIARVRAIRDRYALGSWQHERWQAHLSQLYEERGRTKLANSRMGFQLADGLRMVTWRPTPYQRIVRAARMDRGVILSHDEVRAMAADSAVIAVAAGDDGREAEARGAAEVERLKRAVERQRALSSDPMTDPKPLTDSVVAVLAHVVATGPLVVRQLAELGLYPRARPSSQRECVLGAARSLARRQLVELEGLGPDAVVEATPRGRAWVLRNEARAERCRSGSIVVAGHKRGPKREP